MLMTIQNSAKMEGVSVVRSIADASGDVANYRIKMLGDGSDRESDPGWWYLQATDYRRTFMTLAVALKEEPVKHNHAIIPAVYLLGVAAELFMKTFLLVSGYSSSKASSFLHDLKRLRAECAKVNPAFNARDLIYVTDSVGALITAKGGMRYPKDGGGAIFEAPTMPNSLGILDDIVRPMITEKIEDEGEKSDCVVPSLAIQEKIER